MARKHIKFEDRSICYDKDFLTVTPFKGEGKRDLLVMMDDDGEAVSLSSFKEVAVSRAQFRPAAVDPNLTVQVANSRSHTNRYILVARVTENDKGTVRAIFSSSADDVPTLLVSSAEECFNALDPGACVIIKRGSYDAALEWRPLHTLGAYKATAASRRTRRTAYQKGLGEIRKTYFDGFVSGAIPEIFIGIFSVRGKVFTYSDTTIEVGRWAAMMDALNAVGAHTNDNRARLGLVPFESWIHTIIRAVPDNVAVIINKVRVTLSSKLTNAASPATLWYVNGKKISAPDVDAVLAQATCFGGDQKGYDDFVKSVSRVSMKFHRLVASGMAFKSTVAKAVGEGIKSAVMCDRALPANNNMPSTVNVDVSMMFPVRKKPGKRSEVRIAGAWRKITNIDTLARRSGEKSYSHGRRYPVFSGMDEITKTQRTLLNHLVLLDNWIEDEDQIIPRSWTTFGQDAYRGGVGFYNLRPGHLDDIKRVVGQFETSVADSFREQYHALRKSRELLGRVIEQERVVVTQKDAEVYYDVTGSSGLVYRVKESSGATIIKSTGAHLCVVNGHGNDIAGYDYIVSLISALRHDLMTANKIHTVKNALARKAKDEEKELLNRQKQRAAS